MARRSFRSSSRRPWSSAILKTRVRTPACVSLRLRMRLSSSGPISEMVARTGWPCSPKTSQKVTGQPAKAGVSKPSDCSRCCELRVILPRLADAGEVALDVGREDRHADAAERFGDDLQGDGLAGAGGARDQAMAIGERGQQHKVGFGVGLLGDQHRLGHSVDLSRVRQWFELEVTPVPCPGARRSLLSAWPIRLSWTACRSVSFTSVCSRTFFRRTAEMSRCRRGPQWRS